MRQLNVSLKEISPTTDLVLILHYKLFLSKEQLMDRIDDAKYERQRRSLSILWRKIHPLDHGWVAKATDRPINKILPQSWPHITPTGMFITCELNYSTLCEQLALLDMAALSSIWPTELTEPALDLTQSRQKSPNAAIMADLWNRTSYMVASILLRQPSNDLRTQLKVYFVKCAIRLREVGDLHGCLALVNGLEIQAVSRLKHLVGTLDPHLQKEFDSLVSLGSPESNSKAYRDAYSEMLQRNDKMVPHLAVHKKDLAALQRKSVLLHKSGPVRPTPLEPSHPGHKYLRTSAAIIQDVLGCSNRQYPFLISTDVMNVLQDELANVLSEPDLNSMSYALEPKQVESSLSFIWRQQW